MKHDPLTRLCGYAPHRQDDHLGPRRYGNATMPAITIATGGKVMKRTYLYPLIIGYGFVIPKSCIVGINDLTIGFATTVIGACVTYWMGVRVVERDLRPPTT